MGRPKGGKNRSHSKEEKLELIQRMFAGESTKQIQKETGVNRSLLQLWVRLYREKGESALENKRKPGNSLAKYRNRKELTPMEMLEYENALLKRELLSKNMEILKLKKVKEQERGDA